MDWLNGVVIVINIINGYHYLIHKIYVSENRKLNNLKNNFFIYKMAMNKNINKNTNSDDIQKNINK